MKKHLNILALTAGASLVGAISAQAQLIAYDGFDYPQASAGTFAGSSGGVGDWAASWTDKNNLTEVYPGLTYTGLPTVGNSIYAYPTTSTGNQAARALNGTLADYANANTYEANTVWMSFLWNGVTTAGVGNLFRQATMGFYAGMSPTSGGGSEKGDIGMPNINSTDQATQPVPYVSFWVSHDLGLDPGTAPGSHSSTALSTGVLANSGATDFILVQWTSGSSWVTGTPQTINIWVNPTIGGTLGSADVSYTYQDWSQVNGIRAGSGGDNSSYGGAGVQQVDEIRFGYTADSVETMSVVPEPASMALLGLGGLGLMLFRRKR